MINLIIIFGFAYFVYSLVQFRKLHKSIGSDAFKDRTIITNLILSTVVTFIWGKKSSFVIAFISLVLILVSCLFLYKLKIKKEQVKYKKYLIPILIASSLLFTVSCYKIDYFLTIEKIQQKYLKDTDDYSSNSSSSSSSSSTSTSSDDKSSSLTESSEEKAKQEELAKQEEELAKQEEEKAKQEAEAQKQAQAQQQAQAEEQARQHAIAEQQAQIQQAENNRIVYVARNGTSNVYFYTQESMPYNTNLSRVVAMTEAEAKAQGKRLARSGN